MTTIDWPVFLAFAKKDRPTQNIDASQQMYSPGGAWSAAAATLFASDPNTYRLIFLIEADNVMALFQRKLPVKGANNRLAIMEGSVQDYATALPLLHDTEEARRVGMAIYAVLYQHAREFVKDFKKKDEGDGTWSVSKR